MDINVPLAERMRPKTLKDVIGQEHLIGEGKTLSTMLDKGFISSLILWGPPGSGKTTIAKLINNYLNADFYQLNAVSSGVKEIREVLEKARNNTFFQKKTILFIDEIHRFNKAQQDALLEPVEKGLIILIGATTENPSFLALIILATAFSRLSGLATDVPPNFCTIILIKSPLFSMFYRFQPAVCLFDFSSHLSEPGAPGRIANLDHLFNFKKLVNILSD